MIVIAGIILAALLLVVVFWMLLTRRLREKYAVLWLAIGLIILLLGVFPQPLLLVSDALGVQVPANFLFAGFIVLLLGVALHLSWELSQAEEEVRRLAEEAALARAELAALDERVARIESHRDHTRPEASGS